MMGLHPDVRLRKELSGVVVYRRDRVLNGDVRLVHPGVAAMLVGWASGDMKGIATLLGRSVEECQAHVDAFRAKHPDFFSARQPFFSVDASPDSYLYVPEPQAPVLRLGQPLYAVVMVTDECCFHCRFCCVATRRPGQGTCFSSEVFAGLICDLTRCGVEAILLHGGEPLLHPEIEDLVAVAASQGLHVTLSTKMYVSGCRARHLVSAGLHDVQVSIAAPDAETERAITGADLHGLLSTIRSFKSAGASVRVNTVLTRRAVGWVAAIIRLVESAGADCLSLSPYSLSSQNHRSDFPIRQSDIERVRAAVAAAHSELRVELAEPEALDEFGACERCFSLRTTAVINPRGELVLCDKLAHRRDCAVADLSSKSLEQCWKEDADRWAAPREEDFTGTECSGCPAFQDCNRDGRCTHRAVALHGKLRAPHLPSAVCDSRRTRC